MSSVPVSQEDLETIVAEVSRDLLEKWAIESEIDDSSMADYAALAADTASFVIDSYMGHLNELMFYRAGESGII